MGKPLLRAAFAVAAAVLVLRYRAERALIGQDRAFLGMSERLARRPGFLGIYLRAAVYSRVLARTSAEIQIGFGTCFSRPQASLADHVYVGRNCSLGWVEIERDVMIADQVVIPSGGATHDVRGSAGTPPRELENRYRRVRIGEGTWIGSGAIVMADVGRFCVVGAGAVVTKPVPDASIAMGVPARVVGPTR